MRVKGWVNGIFITIGVLFLQGMQITGTHVILAARLPTSVKGPEQQITS